MRNIGLNLVKGASFCFLFIAVDENYVKIFCFCRWGSPSVHASQGRLPPNNTVHASEKSPSNISPNSQLMNGLEVLNYLEVKLELN